MPGATKIYYISGLRQAQQPIRQAQRTQRARVGAFNITADSTPQLDGWGWADYWQCADWVLWHSLNKQKYGIATANQKFIQWWGSQDGTASPFNWCKYNAEFANYFKAQGIDVGWLLSNILTGAQNVGNDVITVVENVGSGAATTSGVVKTLLPVALFGAAVWGFNKYVKKIF